ncbi:extensin-like domain-containing protein [Xanthobacter autotrophicus]|uniref:extensin-like domain-containing protein n=1 Tax=Xanthobacter autotrophicus TaxID=280 RepID=UPI0037274FBE
MSRVSLWFLFPALLLAGALTGCRFGLETRDPWRVEAEEQCIAQKGVVASAFMEPIPAIDGPGMCGMEHPFRVSAFAEGNVVVEPAARLACPVIHQVDMWVQDVVQPAALAWLGQPVVAISQMSSYSCRAMNNGNPNAKISEHAFGNALDVGAFRLADGRWISVKNGWKGTPEERGFLLQVQAGACERFTTVLAPGSNIFHYDHIHVDLMRHEKGRTICKPAPRPMPAPLIAKAPPLGAPQPEFAPAGAPAEAPSYTPAVYTPQPQAAPPPPAPAPQPSFLSTLFGPRPAPAPVEEPPPPPPPAATLQRPAAIITSSPLPPPPSSLPPSSLPPATVSSGRAPQPYPAAQQPPAPQGMPPGWQVGPQGVPMSYAPSSNPETGSVKRKYYTAPIPQTSTLPLPKAKAGED